MDIAGVSAHLQRLSSEGKTPVLVAADGRMEGVIAVSDSPRPDAREAVAALRSMGLRVLMITGDNHAAAARIAQAVGIDDVLAEVAPGGKAREVKALQQKGQVVAMVGDGVNDAPALATADIGVAMGAAGSAVAVETADIALMGDNLLKLPEAISLAKRTVNVMRQNIWIALITVVVLLVGVFAGGVTMAIGMFVHEGSVLIVILNAMRLLRNTQGATALSRSERARAAHETGRPVEPATAQSSSELPS